MRQTTNISNKLTNENKTTNNQPLSGDSTHRWHASSIIINNKATATLAGIISALDANEMSCETFGTKIEPLSAAVDWQLIVGVI